MDLKHARKLLRPLVAPGLILGGLGVTAPPASATDHIECGAHIHMSTKLMADIGPCSGDGLIVMGTNITLNLNGKKILGANGPGDNFGIRVMPMPPPPGSPDGTPPTFPTGNVIRNGVVDGFDGGVGIFGGGGNTVTKITARNNMNDLGVDDDPDNPDHEGCEVGDGISLTNSSDNTVTNNMALNNGPFGGISVVGDSDRNQIRSNLARNNNRQGPGCGNANQDEGIRIEGPGADDNVVQTNTVEASLLAGIGLHGYVCADNEEPPNQGTIVRSNLVSGTANDQSNGISFLAQGPAGIVCPAFNATVVGNTSRGNDGDGIFVAGNSANNRISQNTVVRNGGSGIFLSGPAIRNVFTNVGPTLFDVVTPDLPAYTEGTTADFRVQSGSGSGDVTAELVPIDVTFTDADANGINDNPVDTSTSGCEQADYDAAGFTAGDVALVQRGTCTFVAKAALAVANGASAIVMFNEGQTGRTSSNFGGVGATAIPVLSATFAVGVALTDVADDGAVTVHIVTNTTNVLEEAAPGATDNTLNANLGRNNAIVDGEDANEDCDNNSWSNNNFETVNQPCVDPDAMVALPQVAGGASSRDLLEGVGRGGAVTSST